MKRVGENVVRIEAGGPWDRAIQAQALEHPGHEVDDHF